MTMCLHNLVRFAAVLCAVLTGTQSLASPLHGGISRWQGTGAGGTPMIPSLLNEVHTFFIPGCVGGCRARARVSVLCLSVTCVPNMQCTSCNLLGLFTDTHSLSLSHTHTHTHGRPDALTHTHIHTHTHTHTHTGLGEPTATRRGIHAWVARLNHDCTLVQG